PEAKRRSVRSRSTGMKWNSQRASPICTRASTSARSPATVSVSRTRALRSNSSTTFASFPRPHREMMLTPFSCVETMSEKPYFVHESAYVDEPASIGPRTRIWHFCHVMKGAEIGSDCSLGQNVLVASGVKIGRGVKIQNNVSLYEGVDLGDYVF